MSGAWMLLSVAAALWTGWWILRAFWPVGHLWMIRAGLAWGLGGAVAGVHCGLWRMLYPQQAWAYRLLDCVLIPLGAWAIGRRWKLEPIEPPPCRVISRGDRALLAATALIALAALGATAGWATANPLGIWDGWAIWNLKARFLYRGGPAWVGVFSPEVWFSHPDYPLLLPGLVARMWTYLGRETALGPQLVAVGYTAMVMALLFAAVTWLKGPRLGCYGLLALVSCGPLFYYGGGQVADVPLSLYVLGAVVAVSAAGRSPQRRRGLLALAGLLAGCAALLKNEGLVIGVAVLAAVVVCGGKSRRMGDGQAVFLGMLLPVAWLVAQKALFPVSSYMLADQPSAGAAVGKLVDLSRHRIILAALWAHELGFGLWRPAASWAVPAPNNAGLLLAVLLPLVAGVRPDVQDRFALRAGWLTVALTLGAYYVALLLVPYDLAEMVKSIPRLQLHVWPALILLLMLLAPARGADGPARCDQKQASRIAC